MNRGDTAHPSALERVGFGLLARYGRRGRSRSHRGHGMVGIERGFAALSLLVEILVTFGNVGHAQIGHRAFHKTCHERSFRVFALLLAQEIRNIQIAGIVRRHHFMLGGLVE